MGIIGSILFFGCIGAVASLGSSTPVMPRSGVLLMDLGKVAMSEQTQEVNPMAVLQGDETQSIGLWDAVQSIKAAAADPSIQYIYLKPEGFNAGIAQIEELRRALTQQRNPLKDTPFQVPPMSSRPVS